MGLADILYTIGFVRPYVIQHLTVTFEMDKHRAIVALDEVVFRRLLETPIGTIGGDWTEKTFTVVPLCHTYTMND